MRLRGAGGGGVGEGSGERAAGTGLQCLPGDKSPTTGWAAQTPDTALSSGHGA